MAVQVCSVCDFEYDEAAGIPEAGIAPGTRMADLPDDWECPVCGASADEFEAQGGAAEEAAPAAEAPAADPAETSGSSAAELAALFANLAKGCEKQFREDESGLFGQLSAYFDARGGTIGGKGGEDLGRAIEQELETGYPTANRVAAEAEDRGAKRALVWSEKVTKMQTSILKRFAREGSAMLESTSIHVCEICGFAYIGDEPPEICPVCKVPSSRIAKVERR